jgi:hypothetical protein
VNHPGVKGNEYLYRPLERIARRRGFIVVKVVRASGNASPTSTGTFL